MANKSESTSPQTGIDTAKEGQLEDLSAQLGNEIANADTHVGREGPGEAYIETFM